MDIGKVTGRKISTNRDGDIDRLLLQVKFTDEDVRTVELFSQHGEDVNPSTGCRVITIDLTDSYEIAIAVSDDLTPEVDPGEKEIYSTNATGSTKKAKIKWSGDGNIKINDGTESAISYLPLDTALQNLVTAINLELQALGGAGALTLDISGAESDTVLLP